jgi:hypothetical protein
MTGPPFARSHLAAPGGEMVEEPKLGWSEM